VRGGGVGGPPPPPPPFGPQLTPNWNAIKHLLISKL